MLITAIIGSLSDPLYPTGYEMITDPPGGGGGDFIWVPTQDFDYTADYPGSIYYPGFGTLFPPSAFIPHRDGDPTGVLFKPGDGYIYGPATMLDGSPISFGEDAFQFKFPFTGETE